MTSRTVVLTGTFGSHNKGDATMQFVVATELKRALGPDDRVVVLSPSADHDREFYGELDVVFSRRRSVTFVFNLGLAALWRGIHAVTGLRPDGLLATAELRETRRAALAVDLSGDMLTEDYGALVGFSHFIPLLQARWLRTPYFICAQSIGPFGSLRSFAGNMLRHAAGITLREDVTRDRVEGLGLEMETTADVSFLLEADKAAAAELLARREVGDRRLVAVSVSPILERRFESAHPQSSFAETVAGALDEVFADQPITLLFVPHVVGPAERQDDRIVARKVAARLATEHLLVEDDLQPAVLKGLIAHCEVLLGARMHANMAALSQGVPLLALAYSHKTEGIMSSFGQGDMIVDGEDLTQAGLVTRIRDLLDQRGSRAAQIRSHHDEVIGRARLNIDRIVALVDAAEPALR